MKMYSDRTRNRLEELRNEVTDANQVDYYDRLRALKQYCDTIAPLASCLAALPQASYDFRVPWREIADRWPGGEVGYAYRWDAIGKAVQHWADGDDMLIAQIKTPSLDEVYTEFTQRFVVPLCNYLVDQLETASSMLYLLLRYKRWAEWFEAKRLRDRYREGGELALSEDLRRFLFESGIDYPYSEPRSPGGQADVVAGLETDDPLVLEIKIWDSKKGYKENRLHDGLQQVMSYAEQYGKDRGYVIVFNLDPEPLVFVGEANPNEWPACLEEGRTYYFIDINIAEQEKTVSKRAEGRAVKTNRVQLGDLVNRLGLASDMND